MSWIAVIKGLKPSGIRLATVVKALFELSDRLERIEKWLDMDKKP